MQNLNEHVNRMKQLFGAQHGVVKPIVNEEDTQNKPPQTPIELFNLAKKKKIFTRWGDKTTGDSNYMSDPKTVTWFGGIPLQDCWQVEFYVDASSPDPAQITVKCTKGSKKEMNKIKSHFMNLNRTGDNTLYDYDVIPHMVATPEEHELLGYQYSLNATVMANKSNAEEVTKSLYEMIQHALVVAFR